MRYEFPSVPARTVSVLDWTDFGSYHFVGPVEGAPAHVICDTCGDVVAGAMAPPHGALTLYAWPAAMVEHAKREHGETAG